MFNISVSHAVFSEHKEIKETLIFGQEMFVFVMHLLHVLVCVQSTNLHSLPSGCTSGFPRTTAQVRWMICMIVDPLKEAVSRTWVPKIKLSNLNAVRYICCWNICLMLGLVTYVSVLFHSLCFSSFMHHSLILLSVFVYVCQAMFSFIKLVYK